ncbi:MAG: 3-phosphoshikimate 1-carboxyvinyltransferase [Euryarchaeota archaeon]|nr:3-phosphoshikimate 1-carboxyvinyltransferase [Euryarchaeota archaeon]
MNITVKKSSVYREIQAPPSKSYMHRAVICASLADGYSVIDNPLICEDTMATMEACRRLGAEIKEEGSLLVKGTDMTQSPKSVVECRGSGTTLRFLTALSAYAPGLTVLTGNESLRKRPMGDLLNALRQMDVKAFSRKNGFPPIIIFGNGIQGGEVIVRGDISSQFISALLLAASKAVSRTVVTVIDPQSYPYIAITVDVLERFGITVDVEGNRFVVMEGQDFSPKKYTVEGDFSSASFLLAAGALVGRVTVTGLKPGSLQGDKKILEVLERMGAKLREKKNAITVEKRKLRATTIDISDTPDLAPIYTVLATQAPGITRIENAGRLRFKESDRLSTTAGELREMGADIRNKEDELVIRGPTPLKGTIIDPHNDHRVAMASALAGLVAEGKTVISNAECINKSYPQFFEDLRKIGADVS